MNPSVVAIQTDEGIYKVDNDNENLASDNILSSSENTRNLDVNESIPKKTEIARVPSKKEIILNRISSENLELKKNSCDDSIKVSEPVEPDCIIISQLIKGEEQITEGSDYPNSSAAAHKPAEDKDILSLATGEQNTEKNDYPNTSTPGPNAFQDESSNDSTTLQIDILASTKKRKHSEIISDVHEEIEEDIEKELEKKAKKTNLTVKNVKSILRYVIGNESVLAMVRNSMRDAGEDDGLEFEPKLTRSKAKQLREKTQLIWPLSPIKPPTPPTDEHLVLIREELPEEEDDEEYKPSNDEILEQSDDDTAQSSVASSCGTSVLGHYLECFDPQLLDSPMKENVPSTSSDFCFKRPLDRNECIPENIGQRTRSKFSLSATPLEAIEQAFIPPDITTDMYDSQCDNQEWENFLKDFMQPLPNENVEGDDDDDPEYNVLADEEEVDKEELRRDKAVTISKTELRRLMIELFQNQEEASSDDEIIKENSSSQNQQESTPTVIIESAEPEQRPPTPPPEPPIIGMTLTQKLLFQQQLRQHIQYITQHFLQAHCHPIHSGIAAKCKILIAELLELGKANKESLINVYNLDKAFNLIVLWEHFLQTEKGKEVIKHMEDQYKESEWNRQRRQKYDGTFHPYLMKFVINSDVFLYPMILPEKPFQFREKTGFKFTLSEDHLVALGLEQFTEYVKKNPRWHDVRVGPDRAAADLIHKYIMPGVTIPQIMNRIHSMCKVEGNPICFFKRHGQVPTTTHHVIAFNEDFIKTPLERPEKVLPAVWLDYIKKVKKKVIDKYA